MNRISAKQRAQKYNDDKLRVLALERCQGLCEGCGRWPDWRGLSLSHTKAKKMGGTSHLYTLDEIEMLCGRCHNCGKHGIKEV